MKKTTILKNLTFICLLLLGIHSEGQNRIDSLAELRSAIQNDNQEIILAPGNYNIEDLPSNSRFFHCTGDNNIIDLTGVYIEFPVGSSEDQHFLITGKNNTLKGGEFENTYDSGIEEISDFVAYNNDQRKLAFGADPHIVIQGDRNKVIGMKLTVRGSFPYGYGSMYGIGRDHVFNLDKRGGIAVQGTNAVIDGCELQMRAFGHGIYIQRPSNNTIVRNTIVEGQVRPVSDVYKETDPSSLPFQADYLDYSDFDNPKPMDRNNVFSLCEDGIRVYGGGGSVEVENCTVKKMRGGIRTYLASGSTVKNSTAVDCGATNFNMPNNGKITGSKGNFSFAPLNDHRLGRSRQDIELTIMPSPNAKGTHNIADIQGNDHNIVFHRTPGPVDTAETRSIVITGDNSTIVNETEYKIILDRSANGNTIISCGEVIDNGSDNDVERTNTCDDGPNQCVVNPAYIEAECYSSQSGVQSEPCSEGGLNIGFINNNDWMFYKGVDLTNTKSINVRVASNFVGGTIEVRLGSRTGTLIGELPVSNTGGNQVWETISLEIENVQGIQDVYLVFKGGDGYLFNINYFGFSEATLSTDQKETFQVTTFPNPVINTLNIQNGETLSFEIYNSLGQLQFKNKVLNNDYEVDMSTYSSGLYFLKTSNGKTIAIQKIIKK